MRRGIVVLSAFCLFLGFSASAEEQRPVKPALVRTFTTRKTVVLANAVAAFVADLIQKNTEIHDQYARLTAATEKAAGGRFQARSFEGLQWWVVNASWDGDDDRGSNTVESIYLARQQLVIGAHRAFEVPTNIVAQVRVVTSWSGRGTKGNVPSTDAVEHGTKVTLTFEGFLKNIPLTFPQP